MPRLFPGARAVILLIGVVAVIPAAATADRYEIQQGNGTRITFTSKAPMETFSGETDKVSGWLDADLRNLLQDPSLEVVVDMASFDTGLSKRNEHMRNNHLETDEYPTARFRSLSIPEGPEALPVGGQADFTLVGLMDLHGVEQPLTCRVNVRDLGGGRIQVEAKFPIKLSDFAIKRPKFLVMKIADEQLVHVLLLLTEAP